MVSSLEDLIMEVLGTLEGHGKAGGVALEVGGVSGRNQRQR